MEAKGGMALGVLALLGLMGHALLVGSEGAVARLQLGGGCGTPTLDAGGARQSRPLAAAVMGLSAAGYALPIGDGDVVARPQPGGGYGMPAVGASGAGPPRHLAVFACRSQS